MFWIILIFALSLQTAIVQGEEHCQEPETNGRLLFLFYSLWVLVNEQCSISVWSFKC